MTITASDIKLFASERMTDTSDGGGRRTSNVIPDGTPGNIFPKVSRLDSVYGRVNLRKVYGAVQTADADTYAGAHAVVMDPPDNDRIHVNLFSTSSEFDDRTAARDRIESYVIAGPESRMTLYGRQLVGQGAFLAYQGVNEPLPEVGEVFCLSKEINDVTIQQQYVRITDVTHEVRTLEDGRGTYDRRIVTLKIATPLRYEFKGPEVPYRDTSVLRETKVRNTTVADAARYFGIKPVTEAAESGALTMRVSSVFSPIVPTTQRETPLSNVEIGGAEESVVTGAQTSTITFGSTNIPGSSGTTVHLTTPAKPGSVTFTAVADGVTGGTWVYTDDGDGHLTSGSNVIDIDYAAGEIAFVKPNSHTYPDWTFSETHIPAVSVSQAAHTRGIEIDLNTRGTVYTQTLHPIPARDTLMVDFRALGKWYRLRDDGEGGLVGDDPAYGSGSIDYITGAVIVTLGALPDVGSNVILSWGSPSHYEIAAGGTSDAGATVRQVILLSELPIKPSSVTVSYVAGSTTYTATETAGVLSGGGITGTVNHVTGEVKLDYTTRLPNAATGVSVAYKKLDPTTATPTQLNDSTIVTDPTSFTLALGGAVISPSTVNLDVHIPSGVAGTHAIAKVVDDGDGNLVTTDNVWTSPSGGTRLRFTGSVTIGTIDYSTGDVEITEPIPYKYDYYAYASFWMAGTARTADAIPATYVWSLRTTAASADEDHTYEADPTDLEDSPFYVELTRTKVSAVVPGSVLVKVAGKTYIERNGTLYADLAFDGTGIEAGECDYETGKAYITHWTGNVALNLNVQACLLAYGKWVATEASFRTAGSPLRAESLYVEVTAEDGTLITATTDEEGNFVSPKARGSANPDMGTAFIQWGEMVTAAGNELEEWYDPDEVVGSLVWKPARVIPDTLRYNAVVLSNLPLNADILGLDPVRLPSDGRVPIFRPADVVVIHNTKSYALPDPAVASATYNVGRTGLSELWLVDADGVKVATDQYIVDKDAGTVTMAADLDLSDYAEPLVARHRIEQLNLLSDVHISGLLTLTSALARDFDEDTYVSSALLFGDMFARVTNVFDQVAFTGVWSDSRIGSNATGEYDTVNHPIEVKNEGCVTERWRIQFTGSTSFQVIGENLGVIATGATTADCTPVNSLTGKPYFIIRAAGWGSGWTLGANLRFNTVGATAPIWMARTVLPGATLEGDSMDLQLRGDVDS